MQGASQYHMAAGEAATVSNGSSPRLGELRGSWLSTAGSLQKHLPDAKIKAG